MLTGLFFYLYVLAVFSADRAGHESNSVSELVTNCFQPGHSVRLPLRVCVSFPTTRYSQFVHQPSS